MKSSKINSVVNFDFASMYPWIHKTKQKHYAKIEKINKILENVRKSEEYSNRVK